LRFRTSSWADQPCSFFGAFVHTVLSNPQFSQPFTELCFYSVQNLSKFSSFLQIIKHSVQIYNFPSGKVCRLLSSSSNTRFRYVLVLFVLSPFFTGCCSITHLSVLAFFFGGDWLLDGDSLRPEKRPPFSPLVEFLKTERILSDPSLLSNRNQNL
jgi:hypothetical protein